MRMNVWAMAAAVAVAAAGCSSPAETESPMATPSVTLDKTRAPLGSPLVVTYRFQVADDAPRLDQDYRVFAHFVDADDEQMWDDDHDPPVPTSQWAAGQVVEYSRTIFLPLYPYIGKAGINVGLYSPGDGRRLPLAGETRGQRAYAVASLELLPRSENIFLLYKDGWHPAEVAPDNAAVEWQWSKRDGVISFRNPRRDGRFYLHLDGRPDLFDEPQQVTVSIGEEVLDRFAIATRDPVIRVVDIAAAQFGGDDMVDLVVSVDRTFVPATLPAAGSQDRRELGVRVFHAYVGPR